MKYSQEIEEALFEALAAIENPEARRAFLGLIGSGDVMRSARLNDLLEARAEADLYFREVEGARTVVALEAGQDLMDDGSFAEEPESGEDEGPGQWIGRYRLVKRIGEGGCGIVYLAEQQEPVQRFVALKVIRLGMDTERVIARFEMERQSLAMMVHPNIARVLDAGETETGRPYFVMEWVRGLRITDFCDENRLDLRERIDLFIAVCKGIQYAHQKGVIHRDIKPSNILISLHDGKPTPTVIDFGVAKAMETENGAETAVTMHDAFIGTPAYMSPEQADQKRREVDTRSDVYSLGVLLYELLTGRPPFDPKELAAAGMTEMRRILMEQDPPVPSSMIAALSADELGRIANHRKTEPTRLVSAVEGDLDWVVMKAIEKDSVRRYETANGFAMDLERYIAHEPVLARPRNRVYLFRKFVRRNRLAVGTSAAIVASLLLGLGVASVSYLRERKSRQEQERLRSFAELAHSNELQQLAEAREWENFAQVSILLSEGKTDEADAKLRETPLSTIQLTPRSSGVLRSLGNWNALRGRWPQAAECFMMLVRAEDIDGEEALTDSMDMLAIGPIAVESGNLDDYVRFRDWAFARFGNSSDNIDLARLPHAFLLTPCDSDFLRKLDPLKATLEATEFDPAKVTDGWEREIALWRAFGLALLEYRQGDFTRAEFWINRAQAFHAQRNYINAKLATVSAMVRFQLGETKAANQDLEVARRLIDAAFTPELPAAYEPLGIRQGYWWDWIIARILFREAEQLIENGKQR